MVLLGWAYMLGITNAKTSRNEADIRDMRKSLNGNLEKLSTKMDGGFRRIYERIDRLPCKDATAWTKEDCNV
jgi:hypothetical protein